MLDYMFSEPENFFKVTISFFVLMITLILSIGWYSSCKEAEVYNKINGTSFTCSDFFWAAGQINTQSQTIKLTK